MPTTNSSEEAISSLEFVSVKSPLLFSPNADAHSINGISRRFPLYRKEGCSGLWRSEDMSCMHVIVQRDVLRQTIWNIGRLGKAQLLDLNDGMMAFARPFTAELRLCEELLRKLRLLEEPLSQETMLGGDLSVDFDFGCSIEELRHELPEGWHWSGDATQQNHPFSLERIEERVDETVDRVAAITSNLCSFHMELNHEHEMRLLYRLVTSEQSAEQYREMRESVAASPNGGMEVFPLTDAKETREMFHTPQKEGENTDRRESAFSEQNRTGSGAVRSSPFSSFVPYGLALSRLPHIAGAVHAASMEEIRRLSYRVCRGNAVTIQSVNHLFFNPQTGERNVSRCMFVIFCPSQKMLARLRKLVEGNGGGITLHTLKEVLERGAALQSVPSPLENFETCTEKNLLRDDFFRQGIEEDVDDTSEKRKKTAKNSSKSRFRVGNFFKRSSSPIVVSSLELPAVPSEEGDENDLFTRSEEGAHAGPSRRAPREGSTASKASSTAIMEAIELFKKQKASLLVNWYATHRFLKTFLRVERAVLGMMNCCEMVGPTATMTLWVPTKYIPALQSALDDAVHAVGGDVPSVMTLHSSQRHPPTYFETNTFTNVFQSIVDSYGTARYKEINPGVFTIVTFPYLFGMMYGDIGHGILLLLVSLLFIYKGLHWRAETLNEMVQMLFGGRYLLLLMSLFAIYMGLLYNDFMGFSLNLFRSGYQWGTLVPVEGHEHELVYPIYPNGTPSVRPSSAVAFGMDSAWAETENKLEFYNSVKMKCAVIVGVVQMFVGLFFSLSNYLYHKEKARIYYLFIPEFVFLTCTFGYMSLLIIIKWCTRWDNTHLAPSLLETMTNFFLQPGTVSSPLFRGQAGLQVFLLLVAFAMVPILLCGMPLYEYKRYRLWQSVRRSSLDGVIITNLPFSGEAIRERAAEKGLTASGRMKSDSTDDRSEPDVAVPYRRSPTSTMQGNLLAHSDTKRIESKYPSTSGKKQETIVDSQMKVMTAEEEAFSAQMVQHENPSSTSPPVGTPTFSEDEEEAFENFEFSELIIHYVIHTIEYVLSTVSNTASYLRLWALSLAHAQLSEVFFNFTVIKLLGLDDSGFLIGFGVLVWLGVTFAVLVGMEALSSFLHALRLHWVEFQNKFYVGDGRPLEPFVLPNI